MVHGLIVAVERKNEGGLGLVGSGRVGSRRVQIGSVRVGWMLFFTRLPKPHSWIVLCNLSFNFPIVINLVQKFFIIDVENRIIMGNFFFCLVTCVVQRRNLDPPYWKVLGKLFIITITDRRKSKSIKPMKLRFWCVEKILGTIASKTYGKGSNFFAT